MESKFDIGTFVNVRTTQAVTCDLVNRVKQRRKESKMSQSELAKKSGVSFGSIRRFEETGEISLRSLLKIADALEYLTDFDCLFKYEKILNLKEYINDKKRKSSHD